MNISRYFCCLVLSLAASTLFAQHDTVRPGSASSDTVLLTPFTVREVPEVNARPWFSDRPLLHALPREAIEVSVATDLPALLKLQGEADIRQRGMHDVQAEISLRGGSFEQTQILVNGIPYNDPQTGHHSMNLPFSLDDIQKIEVSGPTEGVAQWSGYAMGGAVNIITRNNAALRREVRARVTAGSYGLRRGYAALQFQTGRWGHYLSVDESFSDGHTHNTDFRRRQLWLNSHALLGRGVALQLEGGWINKTFGANSFYSPLFPDQAEEITASGLTLRLSGGNRLRWRSWYAVRMHHDRFELFRYEAPEWYRGHNHHRTLVETRGAEVQRETEIGRFYLGWLNRVDQLLSNVLGKPADSVAVPAADAWYTHADRRMWGELSLMFKSKPVKDIHIETAGTSAWLPDGSIFPAFRIHLYIAPDALNNARISAGVSRNYRLPTFTEMYYQGPTNTGNPLLTHEEAITANINAEYHHRSLKAKVTLFLRDNINLIDWVKEPDEMLWRSENLTQILTKGTHLRVAYMPQKPLASINYLTASWTYTDQVKGNADNLISYYVLDHLSNKIALTAHHQVSEWLTFSWNIVWQQRNGTYTNVDGMQTDYPDALIVDGGVRFKMTEALQWQLNMNNVLDTRHFDFSGVPHPGRWFSAGLSIKSPW